MKKRSINYNEVMVAMKKKYHLNGVYVNFSRESDWYKMKKHSVNKRKLEINHLEQERVVEKLKK